MALSPQFLAAMQNMSRQANPGGGLRQFKGSTPETQALAHALLTSGVGDFKGEASNAAGNQGTSVLSRFLDILSRPLYAAADAAYESEDASANKQGLISELRGLGTGALHGISGTEKKTWADVIQQGRDINAHRASDHTSVGYQLGEGGPLSTGDKWSSVLLNILGDPSLTASPTNVARGFGEGSQLYKIPTIAQVSRRAFGKTSQAADAIAAATNEAGGTVPAPSVVSAAPALPARVNPLLDINPKAVATAKSVPDIIAAKIGQPIQIPTPVHPHVTFDPAKLKVGELHPTALTPEGVKFANEQYKLKVQTASADARKAALSGDPAAMAAYRNIANNLPTPGQVANEVAHNAVQETGKGLQAAIQKNQQWISEAVRNGVDPQRAIEVVRGIHAGEDFNTVFKDAVENSKLYGNSKVLKATQLDKPDAIKPAFKLSSILAPTPTEVLKALHASNPASEAATQTIEQARQLNAIKRTAALVKPLSNREATVRDYAVQKALEAINGGGGRKMAMGALNDIVQSHLWENIRNQVAQNIHGGAANIQGINTKTFQIAAHAEEKLAEYGFHGIAGNGTPVRLTDAIANASGYPNKIGAYVNHVINGYANGSLVGAAASAEEATRQAVQSAPVIKAGGLAVNRIFSDPTMSDPVKFLGAAKTGKEVERSILMQTGSTRAAKAGRALYQGIVDNAVSAPQKSVVIAGKALSDIVSTGSIPSNYNSIVADLGRSISEAFSEAGSPIPAPGVRAVLIGPRAAAEAGILGRVATWYGQHDVRGSVVQGLNTAMSNTARWSKLYHDTFNGLTAEQKVESLRSAQGVFEPVNLKVIMASDAIRTRMQDLFSSTGLSEAARRGNTVAMRSGVTMKEMNDELRRVGSDMQFTNKASVDHPFGFTEPRDYSQGTDWLNSWEAHKFIGDPAKNLARIETAVFNVMAKKAIFQEIMDLRGSAVATAEKYVGIKDFAPLKGTYFDPEIAQQITRVIRDLYAPKPQQGQLLRMIDNIMRMWKTQVTIYSPMHSIHNMMGDIYNSWMAGVNSPRAYWKAIQVMRSAPGDWKSLEKLAPFMDQGNVPARIAELGRVPGSRVLVTTKDGQKLTAAQIKMAAHNQGLLMAAGDIEDINLGAVPHIKPFGGRVHDVAHGVVQGADHFTRLAHFIDAVSKGRGDLSEIFRSAGKDVRKFHPDGMDLTDFERYVLRRIIPFYSWTRKAIPFALEGILTKPGKFMAYPKTMTALNYQPGENINPGQQFPTDQLFPSWITDNAIGPAGGPGSWLSGLTGDSSAYTTMSLSIPPLDIMQQYGNHPNQGILSGLNPIIKDPIELMHGSTLDTGIPITNKADYIGQQIPAVGLLERLTNVGLGGVNAKGQKQGVGNQQNFINFLTGLKLTNTGQYIKQAQYEQHLKQKAQKKANAAQMKKIFGGG